MCFFFFFFLLFSSLSPLKMTINRTIFMDFNGILLNDVMKQVLMGVFAVLNDD